jgi:hypothetical protein
MTGRCDKIENCMDSAVRDGTRSMLVVLVVVEVVVEVVLGVDHMGTRKMCVSNDSNQVRR